MHKAEVPKGEIWIILGDKALPFATWLNDTTNPMTIPIKTIFDSLQDVDLESAVFQGIVGILLQEGVITQVEVDAIQARIEQLHKMPSFGHDDHVHG